MLIHYVFLAATLDVLSFKEAFFGDDMLKHLVIPSETKAMITNLTKKYVRKLIAKSDEEEAKHRGEIVTESNTRSQETVGLSQIYGENVRGKYFMHESEQSSWSADFVTGKGEGLIFLLHGKPGVGKTYTAGQFTNLRVMDLHAFYMPMKVQKRI